METVKKSQTEMLQLKVMVAKIKFHQMDSIADMRGQKKIFNRREDRSIEIIPSQEQIEKKKI